MNATDISRYIVKLYVNIGIRLDSCYYLFRCGVRVKYVLRRIRVRINAEKQENVMFDVIDIVGRVCKTARTKIGLIGGCIVFFALIFVVAGCAHNMPPTNYELAAADRLVVQDAAKVEYHIDVGDTLDIKFFYNPELNTTVTVRPDGKISLQLVGEVAVLGDTVEDLQSLIGKKYAAVLKSPEVTVNVAGFGGWKVYVGGEVGAPGIVSLTDAKTVFQAVLVTGGFKETANPKTVLLVRRGQDGLVNARTIDLQGVINGKSLDADMSLHPLDIVFVPKTRIAEADKFVAQYIKQIIPVDMQAAFVYSNARVR